MIHRYLFHGFSRSLQIANKGTWQVKAKTAIGDLQLGNSHIETDRASLALNP
jgi:hypothetical protein